MFGVDVYVFDDEKSIGSGFQSIKPPYIPLSPTSRSQETLSPPCDKTHFLTKYLKINC